MNFNTETCDFSAKCLRKKQLKLHQMQASQVSVIFCGGIRRSLLPFIPMIGCYFPSPLFILKVDMNDKQILKLIKSAKTKQEREWIMFGKLGVDNERREKDSRQLSVISNKKLNVLKWLLNSFRK